MFVFQAFQTLLFSYLWCIRRERSIKGEHLWRDLIGCRSFLGGNTWCLIGWWVHDGDLFLPGIHFKEGTGLSCIRLRHWAHPHHHFHLRVRRRKQIYKSNNSQSRHFQLYPSQKHNTDTYAQVQENSSTVQLVGFVILLLVWIQEGSTKILSLLNFWWCLCSFLDI